MKERGENIDQRKSWRSDQSIEISFDKFPGLKFQPKNENFVLSQP